MTQGQPYLMYLGSALVACAQCGAAVGTGHTVAHDAWHEQNQPRTQITARVCLHCKRPFVLHREGWFPDHVSDILDPLSGSMCKGSGERPAEQVKVE